MLSNLYLQILIAFHYYFWFAFALFSTAVTIYKGLHFYYPNGAIGWEIAMLFVFFAMEWMRLSMASRGNKTETLDPMVKGMFLGTLGILGHAYLLRMQTWVILIEVVANSVGLAFSGAEMLCMLYTATRIYYDQRAH